MTLTAKSSNLTLRFVAGVLLAMALALGLFYVVMQPQRLDLGLMTIFWP